MKNKIFSQEMKFAKNTNTAVMLGKGYMLYWGSMKQYHIKDRSYDMVLIPNEFNRGWYIFNDDYDYISKFDMTKKEILEFVDRLEE